MDNDSIGRHDELRMLSKTPEPSIVLPELWCLCCGACEYLYIAALELMCSDYFDQFGGCVVVY